MSRQVGMNEGGEVAAEKWHNFRKMGLGFLDAYCQPSLSARFAITSVASIKGVARGKGYHNAVMAIYPVLGNVENYEKNRDMLEFMVHQIRTSMYSKL